MKQGILLRLLMGYFKTSEINVSQDIFENIELELEKLVKDLKSYLANIENKNIQNQYKGGIEKADQVKKKLNSELNKEKCNAIKLIEYLYKLKNIYEKSSLMSTSTIEQIKGILNYIGSHSFEAYGFSDSNIHRMTNSEIIDRRKLLVLYQYWFQPLVKPVNYNRFIKEFVLYTQSQDKMNSDYSDIISELKLFFEEQDSYISLTHFCSMFDIFNNKDSSYKKIYGKEEIYRFISTELENIVGKEEAKTRGLSDDERSYFFSMITEQLAEDAKIYHLNIQSPQGNFKALIRYRLSHMLFEYIGKDNNAYKALAYFISNSDFPGNVYIHPAAKIDGGVYLSEQVVIGSNCHIFPDCYIGKNVCIIPFYTGKDNLSEEDIVLQSGVIVGSLVKILGRVHIGRKSYIQTNNLVFCDIPDETFYDGKNFNAISEKKYQNYITKMENNE